MPIYDTPTPIDLAINLPFGEIEVIAGNRADTVVTVSPTNQAKAVDRRGAEETTVDFDGERLTITGPKPRFSILGPYESIDVRIEVPAGSRLTAEIGGGVRTIGRLGATRIKSGLGGVEVEDAGDVWIRAGHGSVTIGTATGDVEITADHGQIRIGTVDGEAILKASHGNVTVGQSGGDLDAKLSYGDLDIAKALASVFAKTAYGSIALAEVTSGSIQVESGYGRLTIGVQAGIPAWLDLASKNGHVRNELQGERAPDASEQTVAVRARTEYGDIRIQRAR